MKILETLLWELNIGGTGSTALLKPSTFSFLRYPICIVKANIAIAICPGCPRAADVVPFDSYGNGTFPLVLPSKGGWGWGRGNTAS